MQHAGFYQNDEDIMPIVDEQDFCVIVAIQRNKTNTYLVNNLDALLSIFWL